MNIIINGSGGSGKDTFVALVKQVIKSRYECYCISSVEKVKEAARVLGWDGRKCDKGRKFLSDLKDMSTELYDGPMKYMESCMVDDAICFFMIREPQEIDKFVKKYPDTKTILIVREDIESFSNHADSNVHEYEYDYTVHNNGTIGDLIQSAEAYADMYILR